MRASFSLLALAAVATATSIEKRQFPACAMQCVATANYGNCQATDNTCLCKDQAFVQSTNTCFHGTCSGNDLNNAIAGARQLCAAAGVTLTDTPTMTATATSPGASGTTSATPSASRSPNSAAGVSTPGFAGGLAALVGFVFAL